MPIDIGNGATFGWDDGSGTGHNANWGKNLEFDRNKLQLPQYNNGGIPAQPQTTPRGGGPKYFVEPGSLYPQQIAPIDDWKSYDLNRREIFKQLIPTSVNLRNQTLQDMISRYNTPMENMYAGMGVGQAANQRAQNISNIEATAASRGLVNSGMYDAALRGANTDYMSAAGQAVEGAREQERTRKSQTLQQMLSVPENDLRFYEAIRSGAVPASSLFGDKSSEGAMQFGQGLQTLVKTLVSMGAGGGGMMGGLGGGGAGAGAFSAGTGGMSGMMGGGGAFGGLTNAASTISLLNSTSDPYQRSY